MPKPPGEFDQYDNRQTPPNGDATHSNIKKKPKSQTAVAITAGDTGQDIPRITAAGRGKLAEQILQLAFANGVKVREDSALAEMLAKIELDSPIPSEAFLAVAEVLSYVYKANGEPNPFDAVLMMEKLNEALEQEEKDDLTAPHHPSHHPDAPPISDNDKDNP